MDDNRLYLMLWHGVRVRAARGRNSMAGDRKKWEAQQNWPKVRAILMEEWDPIGCGVPEDEYDAYVGPIAMMLTEESVTREQIANHLFDIADRCIGLGKQRGLRDRCDAAAAALVSLRTQFGPY
jgi:hypothetical protein